MNIIYAFWRTLIFLAPKIDLLKISSFSMATYLVVVKIKQLKNYVTWVLQVQEVSSLTLISITKKESPYNMSFEEEISDRFLSIVA